jgi:hypothetical protein
MTAIMTDEAAIPRRVVPQLPVAVAICVFTAATFFVPAAQALEEQKGEAAAIEACDKRLCAILVGKSPQGPDLKCALTKTWARSKIKEADSRQLSWGFGDARCTVDINLSRQRLVEAMTAERNTFHAGRYTANCVVEQDGKLEKVTAVVAPKIEFRNGKADKVWVRLKSVDGPASVTLTLQTAAQLADTFGIFHRQMLKNINRYIQRHCPKILDVASTPSKVKDKADK